MLWKQIISNILFWSFCESARILAIMPTPSYSHQIVFRPLWRSLSLRGHEMTLLTTHPIDQANLSNFKQIDWSSAYDLWHKKHDLSNIIRSCRGNMVQCFNKYVDMMHEIVIQELEHPEVQTLIKDGEEHFDLVIVELLHPTMLAFSERFKCPFIGVSSMDITTFSHNMLGNPTNPAVYTDFLSPYDTKMSFIERVHNTLHYIGSLLYFHCYLYPREDGSVQKYFGEWYPKLKFIQKNISMVFINTHPVLHDARPLMPNVIQIGGAPHLHKLQEIPQDLRTFLDEAENGVIYFSLGSNVKISHLPLETIDALFKTFSQSQFRVVWKVEDATLFENVSSNIFMGNWLPQQEILAHKNMRLFITQGGQQSVEEAIYYEVPIIGIPMYVDQLPNIRRLVRREACIQLDSQDLKLEELQNAIKEVTTNKRYSTAIKELSTLLKEPSAGLDQAVWWAEYVIKHKGAKFLKSDVSDMPIYQYFLLDVIATFTVMLTICLYIQYKITRFLITYIRCKINKNKFDKVE